MDVVRRGKEYFGLVLTSWIEEDSDEDSDDFCDKYLCFYSELRSYTNENDVLVERKTIWKGEESIVSWGKTFKNWAKVFSTVVVENVYL